MSGPEKKVEDEIKAYLSSKRIWHVKFHADNFTPPGVPDILACINGRFVGIEVKAPNKLYNTSKAQKVQIANIIKSGGIAFATNNAEKCKEIIDSILRGEYGGPER